MPDKNYTPPQSQLEQSFYNFLNRGDWRDNYRTVAPDLSSQMQDSSINLGFDYSDDALWDRARQNWRMNEATKRAKERLEKERIPSVATSPYDVTKGWRESTEDSAKLDKYILEELGYSPEEAQKAYDETWSNSRKALGVGSAATLGTMALMGISGGAAGPVAADVVNGLFATDAVKNLASNNGIQKTYRLAKQGDTWGAIKSGAWDALDLSILGHTAGIARRVGKSMLNGSTFGNAYRSDIAGRMFNSQIKAPKITPAQQNILAGKIGWGPKTTEILYHHSNEPLSELDPMFKSWDVIERGAPRGKVWLTEDSGTAGFLAERPYHQTAEVTLTKPMVQIGEAIGNGKNAVRNDIVRFAQDAGADGIQFKGIADNQLPNQNVTASFKPEKLKRIIVPGSRPISEAERLGIPKDLRGKVDTKKYLQSQGFALPRKHLQGEDAVKMFKEYGVSEIPENSQIIDQLKRYVPEVRERYWLTGNTNISDDEIAGSLYKKALELGDDTAAVNEVGEPLVLFRGDTKRYLALKPRMSPEKLATKRGTMDNSLGTLFLDYPNHYQGVDRYLGTIRNFNGDWEYLNSGTGSKVIGGARNFDPTTTMPKGTYLLYSGVFGKRQTPISVWKLPGNQMESGVNDLNGFVVRTKSVRDATPEISVLNDDWLAQGAMGSTPHMRTILIEDENGFPLFKHPDGSVTEALAGMENRPGMAEHYRFVLDDAKSKDQGLLWSRSGAPLRDEHTNYNYYALPNFNIRSAKHLLPFDFRIKPQWNSRIIYRKQGGKVKSQSK